MNNKVKKILFAVVGILILLNLMLFGILLMKKNKKQDAADNNQMANFGESVENMENDTESVLSEGDILIDSDSFPDAAFRELILEMCELNDGILRKNQILSVDSLDVSGREIQNLKGIEYFVNLKQLECDYSQLENEEVESIDEIVAHENVFGIYAMDCTLINLSGIKDWNTSIENIHYLSLSGKDTALDIKQESILIPEEVRDLSCEYLVNGRKRVSLMLEIEETEKLKKPEVIYRTAVQQKGWMPSVVGGEVSGTIGESKRLETIRIEVVGEGDLGVEYALYCQNKGWMPSSRDGEKNGTEGESLRAEAIKIWLTGNDANKYDIYYRVSIQGYGWLMWTKNGEETGTFDLSKRMEAVQIILVDAGEEPQSDLNGISTDVEERKITKEMLERQESDQRFLETFELVKSYGFRDFNGHIIRGNRGEWEEISVPNISNLIFYLDFENAKDLGDYYEVKCVISKVVVVQEPLSPGEILTVSVNDMTREFVSYYVLENGNLQNVDNPRDTHPNPEENHGHILTESDNSLRCVIATGVVRIYHGVNVPSELNYIDRPVETFIEKKEELRFSNAYDHVVFDDDGYITLLFFRGK